MERERRKVQLFTANQVEELRSFLAQKTTEPPPQPDSCMIREAVRAMFPELSKLRENGYSLNMLIRLLEEKGVKITATALSRYMTALGKSKGEMQTRVPRRERSQVSSSVPQARGQFAMRADVAL
jgi:hypothetical protein